MEEKNCIKKNIVEVIIIFMSYMSVISMSNILDKIYNISKFTILYVFLFLFDYVYIKKYIFDKNYFDSNKHKILFSTFSFLFSFFYLIGVMLKYKLLLSITNILMIMWTTIGVFMPFTLLITKVDKKIQKILASDKINEKVMKNNYFVIWSLIFFSWFLVFLAYYPGLFNYDVIWQISQKSGSYSAHHPLIHTIILNFFYNLFSNYRNLGISLYTISQMGVLAFSFTYEIIFMQRLNMNKKFEWLCLLWIAITPFFSILSISITKDVYFTAFFIIFLVNISYISYNEQYIENKKILISTFLSIILVGLFRNNGLYIMILSSLIIAIKYRKNRKIFKVMFFSIIILLIINKAIVWILHAKKGSPNEMLSIPYQQLARIYCLEYKNINKKDRELIENLIPAVKQYNKYVVDVVKADGQAWNNKNEFIKIYFKYFIKYPNKYLEAFLYNNMGYWYIDDTSNAEIYGKGLETRQGYLLTDTKQGFDVVHISYLPKLEEIYEELFSNNIYQKIPIISIIFSLAIYLWIFLFCIFKNIYMQNRKTYIVMLPIVFLFGTIFLGPCALIRYAFPYISVMPLILSITYNNRNL